MTLTATDRATIERLPKAKREIFWLKLASVEACSNLERGQNYAAARQQADLHGVTTSTVQKWIAAVKQHGPTGLIG